MPLVKLLQPVRVLVCDFDQIGNEDDRIDK